MTNNPKLENYTGDARRWLATFCEADEARPTAPSTAAGWLRELAAADDSVVQRVWPELEVGELDVDGSPALNWDGLLGAARVQAKVCERRFITLADVALALGELCGQEITPQVLAVAARVAAAEKPSYRSRPLSTSGGERAERRSMMRDFRRHMGLDDDDDDTPLVKGDYTQAVGGVLGQFGTDLTHEAHAGRLPRCVGRETELETIMETLCRQTKSNPVLLGPAGSGKTALAEAVAQRLVEGNVPEKLRGKRLVSISAANFIAGAGIIGTMERRVARVIEQAIAQDAIVFIDELHMVTGAGATRGNEAGTLGNALKPALSRPGFACIGATTPAEYKRYVATDTAFERRFQPITIDHLSAAASLEILAQRDEAARAQGSPACPPEVQAWLVEYADRFMLNRHFPDKAIDLYEQCVAYALNRGLDVVDLASAQLVTERLLGVPPGMIERVPETMEAASKAGLLDHEEAEDLGTRLSLSLSGLHAGAARPNAVLALLGEAARTAPVFAELLATHLLGAPDRVITVDFSGMVHAASVYELTGSRSNGQRSVLQAVEQMPWSVLVLHGVESAAQPVRDAVARMLGDGYLELDGGRKICLAHTIVLLAVDTPLKQVSSGMGFRDRSAPAGKPSNGDEVVAALLGETLATEVDVIVQGSAVVDFLVGCQWISDQLPKLAEQLAKLRLTVRFHPDVVNCLALLHEGEFTLRDWRRTLDRLLLPQFLEHVPAAHEPARTLEVRAQQTGLYIVELSEQELELEQLLDELAEVGALPDADVVDLKGGGQ